MENRRDPRFKPQQAVTITLTGLRPRSMRMTVLTFPMMALAYAAPFRSIRGRQWKSTSTAGISLPLSAVVPKTEIPS